ncbi:extensin-like, homolog of mammalian LYST-INTERACTING PROTEIN5 [Hibiscus trionum]|uniref:Extensin-like, homolog of mammalian LYST-INTERACTING PROTEIN5 n=1 Tax=Hibiscus trionum TaxID=183268 RepID=A0A9W7IYU8_HIBTR|nr:extensin-like, homolog of mammalian LYST-INTERACTING PROTEIN5 [Hibiscus trionum]
MASENEPAKLILPYLQRADELQKHDPLVAYYCRLYAMEKGLKIPNGERTKTTNALLVSLMNQLEKDKKSVKLGPEDNLHLEGFALNVFAKADKQDRAGRADLNTAKTFYAASIFFEIINQFGPLQPDLEQKQKYAAWKAADIRKALKEGRKPNSGPPNGDEDLSIPSSTHNGAYDLGSSEVPVTSPRQDSNPPPQFCDEINNHHYDSIPPPSQSHDKIDRQHSLDILPPPPSFPPGSYPSQDQSYPQEPHRHFPSPPPANNSEDPAYSHSYHHQPYPQEPQLHLPHGYPSHDVPLHSYPNFQSYPSFSESSLPSAPSHYPSYHQGSETPYAPQSAPPPTSYPSTPQYSSTSRNETVSEPAPAPAMSQKYQYDSNYQPAPEKIAEAHKAARFAVGALAFDDVSVAVEHLKKSLELLTNPSASQ